MSAIDRKTERRMTETSERGTHFGFETVPEHEKAGRVRGVFTRAKTAVAARARQMVMAQIIGPALEQSDFNRRAERLANGRNIA